MKNKFLIVTKLFITLVVLSIFTISCENDDFVPEFTLQEASEQIAFVNSFSNEYLLSSETKNNIAERFVWNQPAFDVQTAVSYSLEGSTTEAFDNIVYESGTLSDNNQAVTVGTLLTIAQDYLNLDDDPTTDDKGNTGTVYFRVKAFPGTGDGQDAIATTSDVIALNITIIEKVITGGIQVSSWGVVGSGYNNWGAFPDAPFYTTSTNGVIVSYVTLVDGEIKFRENNQWGGDLGDANSDGILDQDADNNIAVTAGNYKITIDLNDNSYSIEEFSWGVVGSGYNNWGADGPDAKFYYDYTTDTFKVGVKLIDGQIKFRPNETWSGDYGDANGDGILDQDADNNIDVTAGYYLITINFNDLSYTIEEATLWGVVGSGYNDWGSDIVNNPDYQLTEINPNIWYAEGVPLIDGEIKFRPNETWSGDYGDANDDGVLDQDADNNITVEAGNYVIKIDFTDPSAPTYYLGKR